MKSTKVLSLIWFAIVAVYAFAALSVTGFQNIPVAQDDSLLYYQCARRIVEGAPFSFSYGELVSTGTTSVLYPFVLAVPYALGVRGSSLIAAGFLLNAVFFWIFILCWWKAIDVWFEDGFTKWLSILLIAFSGQAAFCAMAQSDIGIWMALSAVLAYGFASGRQWVYGVVLALSPWFRPEGVLCILGFGAIVLAKRFIFKESNRRNWLILAISLVSVAGVFLLNYTLTGEFQFSSVSNKGHFHNNEFWKALPLIATDGMKIFRGLILGLDDGFPREFHVFPLIGGILAVVGVLFHDWNRKTLFQHGFWLLMAAGNVLIVANSGWQNTNMDRYLVWLMPVLALFVAEGATIVGRHLPGSGRWIVFGLLVFFAAAANLVIAGSFFVTCRATEAKRLFAADCEKVMAPGASVGASDLCGAAYEFSDRRLKQLGGIYSPEFQDYRGVALFEALKNNPALRFDYWFEKDDLQGMSETDQDRMLGKVELSGPGGLVLRRTDWRVYDNSFRHGCDIPAELNLVARVDVGDTVSENAAAYEIINRYGLESPDAILEFFRDGDNSMFEVARVVRGGVRMVVSLIPGKDAVVVLRTKRSGSGYCFSDTMRFNLAVNDNIIGECVLPLKEKGFSDVSFRIPGGLICSEKTAIGILGDHLSCCYWIYQ